MLSRKGDFRAARVDLAAPRPNTCSRPVGSSGLPASIRVCRRPVQAAEGREKPDYARAAEFYQKALEVGPEPAKRIEVEMLLAQCRQQSDAVAAAGLYRQFIQNHPRHAWRSRPASAWASAGWPCAT